MTGINLRPDRWQRQTKTCYRGDKVSLVWTGEGVVWGIVLLVDWASNKKVKIVETYFRIFRACAFDKFSIEADTTRVGQWLVQIPRSNISDQRKRYSFIDRLIKTENSGATMPTEKKPQLYNSLCNLLQS